MLISVADFDLLNDQALTPQLLRASKPLYALAATIPPPICLTGGTNAGGEHVDILRSLTRLPRYISERHCGRICDFSLSGDREDRQNAGQDSASTIPRGGTPNEHRSH